MPVTFIKAKQASKMSETFKKNRGRDKGRSAANYYKINTETGHMIDMA